MPIIKLPPKIGSVIHGMNDSPKIHGSLKKGVDKYCLHCKRIFAGPDKERTMEFQHDTSRQVGPAYFNQHRIDFETCPECLERGHPKFGLD